MRDVKRRRLRVSTGQHDLGDPSDRDTWLDRDVAQARQERQERRRRRQGAGFWIVGYAFDAWAPLRLPYLVSEALMLAAVIALAAAPETVTTPRPRPRYRPQRVSVPPADRSLFYAAGFAAAAGFALFGLFTSVVPGFIGGHPG